MHFHSYDHGQTVSIGKGIIACKNGCQKRGKEASGISKTQTEKFPSTTKKIDQIYDHLQYMTDIISIYKCAKIVM